METFATLSIDGVIYQYNPSTQEYIEMPMNNEETEAIEVEEDSITEEASTSTSIKKNVWDKFQTTALMEMAIARKEDFSNPRYKKSDLYKDVANDLKEQGHTFSAEQVNNQMKTLTSKYKAIKDHNARSGNNPKTFEYFQLTERFYGDRPRVTPVAACSSFSLAKEPSSDSSSEIGPIKKKKVIGKSPRTEMMKWLKEFKSDVEQREKTRMDLVQRHHSENQTLLKELIMRIKKNNPDGEN